MEDSGLSLFGQFGLFQPLLHFLDFGVSALLIPFTQFHLDSLDLLPQVILPLGLFHLTAHTPLNILLQPQDLPFAVEEIQDFLQPFIYRNNLQQLLLFLEGNKQLAGDGIGQTVRFFDMVNADQYLAGDFPAQPYILAELLFHDPHQSLQLIRIHHPVIFRDFPNRCFVVIAHIFDLL